MASLSDPSLHRGEELFHEAAGRDPECRGARPFRGQNAAVAVTPDEARKRVGGIVTVRFKVAAARRSPKGATVSERPPTTRTTAGAWCSSTSKAGRW
jgi:hypothetical protein